MKEFKFRAWDEQQHIMHTDVEFLRSGTEGNDWILFKSDKQTLEAGEVLNNLYFQQQIKLMQSTGLQDVSGTEIYEGDIVTRADNKQGEVIFGRHLFEGTITASQGYYFGDYFTLEGTLEVVGNTYENPELLEENK